MNLSRVARKARGVKTFLACLVVGIRVSVAARGARRENFLLSTALPPGEVSLGFVRHSNFLLVLYIRGLECGARSAP